MASLKLELKNAKHDTARCNILNNMIEAEANDKVWPIYNNQLKTLAEINAKTATGSLKKSYLRHLANALNNLGYFSTIQGNIPKALDYYHQSLKIMQEIGDDQGISYSYNNIGSLYKNQGDIQTALDYYSKSLTIQERVGDKKGIAYSLINIGLVYNEQHDIEKALDYYERSLKIREQIGDKQGIATSLNNIGSIYNNQGNVPKALEYFDKSLKIREEIGDKQGIANSNNNIGFIYNNQGKYLMALNNYAESLRLYEEIGDKQGMAYTFNNLAKTYFFLGSTPGVKDKKKKYSLALSYSNSSLAISKKLGFPELIRNIQETLSQIDSARGNYAGAFHHYKEYIIFRDSISNEQTRKASYRSQLKYDFEKKELVLKEQQEKERAVAEEKSRFQQVIIGATCIGLVLVIVFAIILYRSLKQNKKANYMIAEKQREILDSIHYAKRIQSALMPSNKLFDKELKRLKGDQKNKT